MNELKPCPFCGGKAMVSKIYYIKQYEIICTTCGATVQPICSVSEKDVIEAWNRRAHE